MQSVQCFLVMPELDFLIRHPSFFPVASTRWMATLFFSEFSAMIRAGNQTQGTIEGWHRDFKPNPKSRLKILSLSAIYYLTDVDEMTARYTLVPASHEMEEEPKKIRAEAEERVGEVEMLGPAGTVILVNSGIWHCGKWGHGPRERRTIHTYYQQSVTEPVSNQSIFPATPLGRGDREQRRFYSHFNPLTRAVVADYVRDGSLNRSKIQ